MLQNDVSGYHKITLHQANILHHTGVLTGALRTFKDRHFLSDERTFTDRSAKVLLIFKNLDSFTIIVLSLLYLFVLIKSAVVCLFGKRNILFIMSVCHVMVLQNFCNFPHMPFA